MKTALEAAIERYRTCDWLPGEPSRFRYAIDAQRQWDAELIADAYIDDLDDRRKQSDVIQQMLVACRAAKELSTLGYHSFRGETRNKALAEIATIEAQLDAAIEAATQRTQQPAEKEPS